MRLVVIASSSYPELNGGSTNLHRRLELLSAWGHDVLLLIPNYAASEFYTEDMCKPYLGQIFPRVRAVAFPSYQFFMAKGMSPSLFAVSRMAGVIRAFRPDLIQIESPERLFYGSLEVPGLAIARELDVPIIGVHHTNYVRVLMHYRNEPGFKQVAAVPGVLAMLKGMMNLVYNSYAVCLTDTEVAAASLREYGIHKAERAAFLGLDLALFNTSAAPLQHPKLAAFGDRFRLVHVGRVTPDKRYHLLFQALDLVEQRRPGRVALLVVGGGFPSIERELLAREGPRLAWMGFVEQPLLPPCYRACDAFVTASPDETAGLVVMEAMACGLPAIGPAAGGVGEFIASGVSGLTFPPGSVEALAEAILRLADDAQLRARLAAGAREAAGSFSVEAGTRRVEVIAKRVVDQHQRQRRQPARPLLSRLNDRVLGFVTRRGGVRWLWYFAYFFVTNAIGWLGWAVFRLVRHRFGNKTKLQHHHQPHEKHQKTQ